MSDLSLRIYLWSRALIVFQVVGRWEQLRDNVRQFILQEASAESYMGVVIFGSPMQALPMRPLNNNKNREDLANFIPETPPSNGSKALGAAIQRGVEVRVSLKS